MLDVPLAGNAFGQASRWMVAFELTQVVIARINAKNQSVASAGIMDQLTGPISDVECGWRVRRVSRHGLAVSVDDWPLGGKSQCVSDGLGFVYHYQSARRVRERLSPGCGSVRTHCSDCKSMLRKSHQYTLALQKACRPSMASHSAV